MKKFSLILIGVILGGLISLGYLFLNKKPDQVPELMQEIEKKKEEVIELKETVDSLKIEVDSLRSRKPERIKEIISLPPKETIVYIEKKLDEADTLRTDSISFLTPDSTSVQMSIEDVQRINGIIEEREILKEEVVVLDSIIEKQDSIITVQDTIIIEQGEVIEQQGKEIKKQKKKVLGISIGGGSAAIAAILLILLL